MKRVTREGLSPGIVMLEKTAPVATTDEIGLGHLFEGLLQHARLLAVAIGVSLVLAVALIVFSPPIYKATTKVLIDTRQLKVLGNEELLPGLNSDTSAIDTQVELLTSGNIARRVLSMMQAKKGDGKVSSMAFTDTEIQAFLAKLTVARKGLTYVLDINYAARDPVQAANTANAIAEAYIAEEANAAAEVAQRANTWLQERIKGLEPEVLRLDQAIQNYRATHGLISVGEQSIDERNLVDYIGQLGLAKAALAQAQAKRDLDQSKSSVSLQSQDEYDVAKMKVALMERGLDALTAEVINRRNKAIELQELEREATATKDLYEALLKRQREIEAQVSQATQYARVIQVALPPAYPSWPRKVLILAAGAFIGLTAGVLIVIGRIARVGAGARSASTRNLDSEGRNDTTTLDGAVRHA